MGACATKPKTLEVEGKAPKEAAVQTPKVAPDTTIPADQVAADQTPEKVVEEAKKEPAAAAATALELATDVVADPKAEVTATKAIDAKDEEVAEKIVEEESSAPLEETAAEVVEETTEVKNAEEKTIQQS